MRTISFIIFLSFAASGYAQFEKHVDLSLSNPVQKTIVRNNGDTGFVSYVETTTQHLFIKADDTMGVIFTVELPFVYTVNDFEIYENMAFFCGHETTPTGSQLGLIGYFYLDSICVYKRDVYIYSNITVEPGQPLVLAKNFTELEIVENYTPRDSIAIVMIGIDGNDRPVVLEAIGPYNNPTNWRYALGYKSKNEEKETFEQISVTEHYVATGGTVFDDLADGISFRFFIRHNNPDMFYGSTLHNDVYRYPTNSPIPPTPLPTPVYATLYPVNRQFEMTAVKGDRIATLSICDQNAQPQMYYGILLNVYDIPQTISTPNINCLYSMHNPPAYNIGSTYVSDLRYDAGKDRLLALLTVDVPGVGTKCVCGMIHYSQPLPFNFDYYTIYGLYFNKVVLTDYGVSYLSSGHSGAGSPIAEYYKYPLGTSPNCSVMFTHGCSAPEEFTSKSHNYPLDTYRGVFSFNMDSMPCLPYRINRICY